ncbi:MAG: DUF5667 domain-containing protein [bacterium]|nr:DUF5667 domain-containing protein [bacterium]
MKNVIIGLTTFVLLLAINSSVFAQEDMEDKIGAPEASITAEYKLPYPGMLPDSPFYKLKTLRDKIVLGLISDHNKKAAKYLEMADKQLYSALKVAEKGNVPLALHTAFKGEHNMTLLVDNLRAVLYSGGDMDFKVISQAHQASAKHQELLQGMMGRGQENEKEQFAVIMEFSTRNNNQLSKLEEEATYSADLLMDEFPDQPTQ